MRAILVFFLLSTAALAATIRIPTDYPTIQAGIDAAVNNDTVLVDPGTYVENINFKGKAITVKSSNGPGKTTINGGQPANPDFGSVVTFDSKEGRDSILDGFTLTNGTGTLIPVGFIFGGGIYCGAGSSPTIKNNTISNNTAKYGGGIYAEESFMLISNNTITGNSATSSTSSRGGGIYFEGAAPNRLIIENNIISGNVAFLGGGINFLQGYARIHNNIISGNNAFFEGGGIRCSDKGSIIINNTITKNSAKFLGGGINCFGNSYGTNIVNTILWDNTASGGPEIRVGDVNSFSDAKISHSDVKGGKSSVYIFAGANFTWGAGMIDQDPLFVDAPYNDTHLTAVSPCKDTGDNSYVTELFDHEGDPRIAYGTVDMGADEFHRHLYCTGDMVPGGNIKIKVVGDPLPVWLYAGLTKLDPPMPSTYGDWYLKWPFWGPIVTSIPPSGVNELPVTIPTPMDVFLQSFVGPHFTNLCVLEI